ncbi:MAG: YlbF family regulator [Candidatus Pacebacteria bacterium]|jgi:cell fate (sporulation/competence/biofilm development) regulator YlbF (YheA/YmcA/DUF963 family)|nr:YlbF family regulator [Candidatus Paceibacterota bacterium]
MNNLEQKIVEFSQAVRETKEWQAYTEAARAYESDKAAQKLPEDLQMAQGTLDAIEQGNFPGREEQRAAYEHLLDQVRKNRVIDDFFDARKRLEALVGDLATTISHEINFPFTLPPKKSCGCSG